MEYNATWIQKEYQKGSLGTTVKVDKKSLAIWYMAYIDYS